MSRGGGVRAATVVRRAEILAAALQCFTDQGFDATTIHDIRRAADCSIGSLYHHFGSKEGIAGELFLDGFRRLNRGRIRGLRGCSDAESSVKTVVRHYAAWVTRNRAIARYLCSRDVDFSVETRMDLRAEYRTHINEVFVWFSQYLEGREMRRLPAETYVSLIGGPIQEYTRQWLSGRVSRSPESVKEVFAEAAWRAVKSD